MNVITRLVSNNEITWTILTKTNTKVKETERLTVFQIELYLFSQKNYPAKIKDKTSSQLPLSNVPFFLLFAHWETQSLNCECAGLWVKRFMFETCAGNLFIVFTSKALQCHLILSIWMHKLIYSYSWMWRKEGIWLTFHPGGVNINSSGFKQ